MVVDGLLSNGAVVQMAKSGLLFDIDSLSVLCLYLGWIALILGPLRLRDRFHAPVGCLVVWAQSRSNSGVAVLLSV